MTLARLLLMVLFLATAFAGQAAAQEGGPTPSPDEINAIAKNLYCPVCENVPLDVCPTQACIQWRQQIGDLLAQGYTEQEVYDYFVERYGDRVLAAPPARGLNWLIYILPPLVLLAGIFWLTRGFAVWRGSAEPHQTSPLQKNDEYLERLEDELKARK
jgi:cytochrome c-type biogenesis protein CcmH